MTAITIINSVCQRIHRPATEHDTFRDLGMDDLDRICIANEIEERFGCELSDMEVERWASVDDVAQTVALVERAREVV